MLLKKTFAALMIFIIAGCSAQYARLDRQIKKAVTPGQITDAALAIGLADISDDEKKKLSLKLVKRALTVFRLYVEAAVSGDKLPEKDEIIAMLKFLSANTDKFYDKDVADQARKIAERLADMLVSLYLGVKK